MKQGGWSWNSGANRKKGIQQNHKCSICGRQYKQGNMQVRQLVTGETVLRRWNLIKSIKRC